MPRFCGARKTLLARPANAHIAKPVLLHLVGTVDVAQVDEAFLRALAAHSTCPHPSGHGLTWRFDPLHRTPSPIGFDAARFSQCLRAIQVPTLVVQGERGFRTPDHEARVALLPRPNTQLVAGAGHMVHWSHAREIAALLNEHFAQV